MRRRGTRLSASTFPGAGGAVGCVLGEVDLLRALRLAGIPAAVVARPGNPARYSRATFETPTWVDPATCPEALVEQLLAFALAQPERPVLFYDGDWDLLVISRHRARLEEAFRFVIADAELIEALVDKARFQTLAEELELPVPRARRIAPGVDDGADLDLHGPLLVKPLTREHGSWQPITSAKAIHVESRHALPAIVGRLVAGGVEALVQEVVIGPESRVESYHVYIDGDGQIAGEFTGRKLRTYPRRYGYSTALEITQSADVAVLGREVVRRLGLRGVAKLDFKRAPDGGLHLLEVNPRSRRREPPGASVRRRRGRTAACTRRGARGRAVVQSRARPPGGARRGHRASAMARMGAAV
jgi:D-aspartate ligase